MGEGDRSDLWPAVEARVMNRLARLISGLQKSPAG